MIEIVGQATLQLTMTAALLNASERHGRWLYATEAVAEKIGKPPAANRGITDMNDNQQQAKLLPARLHHNAWVVEDQERTRHFYEDILGMPLVQFWIEDVPFEGAVMSHAFYGMSDGSALAFFCMANSEAHEKFKSPVTELFNHVALKVDRETQDSLLERITAAGYKNFSIEHGYCRSLYVTDPDGLRLEFALDAPNVEEINAVQARTAHETLNKWVAGHRKSNNTWGTDRGRIGVPGTHA